MNGLEEHYRQMIREEVRAVIVDDLAAIREGLEELQAGTPPELRGMLTLDQVGEYLGVTSQTARKWCHENRVKLHKIGAATRVHGEDVYRVLKSKLK